MSDRLAEALAAARQVYTRFHAGDLDAVRGPSVAALARELLALSSVETPDGPAYAIPGLQGAALLFWARCAAAERSGEPPNREDETALWALVDALTEVDPALVPFSLPPRRQADHWRLFDTGRQALNRAVAAYPFDHDGVRAAADLMRQAVEASEGTPDHATVLGSYGATMIDLYQCGGAKQDIEAAVTAIRAALAALPPAHEMRPALRGSLGGALVRRYEENRDPADLDDAEAVLRALLADEPAGLDPTPALADLASALNARVLRTDHAVAADVEAALTAVRDALAVMPEHHPSRPGFALVLGRLLDRRGVGPDDVAETVAAFRAGLAPTAVEQARRTEPVVLAGDLLALAGALLVRVDPTDGLPPEAARDLDECVALARTAADLVPDRPEALASLGLALRIRWLRENTQRGKDEAAANRGLPVPARADRPDPDEDLLGALAAFGAALELGGGLDVAVRLGTTWTYRFDVGGDPTHLERGIAVLREVVAGLPDDHPDAPAALVAYGGALVERYRLAGDRSDVDTAIEVLDRAVGTAASGSATWRDAAGAVLSARSVRFERVRDPADVDTAIRTGRALVASLDPTDVHRGGALWRLGAAHWLRYTRSADLADANTAVDLLGDALAALPFDDDERASAVTSLGNVLAARAQHLGSTTDIVEAARCFQAAVAREPEGPERVRARLNLGRALSQLARTSLRADHYEQAESTFRALLAEDTDQRTRTSATVGLGSLVSEPAGRTGDIERLDEAIALLRSALADEPIAATLNLANALKLRFGLRADRADLDEAIAVLTALPDQAAPADTVRTLHLGDLWSLRAGPGDADRAYRAYLAVADGGAILASYRVVAARYAAGVAARARRWDDAVAAYTTAVELLPLMAWGGLSDADKRRYLADFAGLAGEAAAAALSAGRPETAVELLEHGRAVLWTQVLRTRGDPAYGSLDGLPPDLAAELAGVRAAMQAPPVTATGVALPAEVATSHTRMVLAHREQELLDRVRAQPGFADFLRRKGFADLAVAASDGPVVLVNLTPARCDALVVTPAGVRVVALPTTFAEAAAHAEELLSLRPGAGLGAFVDAQASLVAVLAWAWDAVVAPVLAAVPDATRVWWCPAGFASLFPLHVAGRYADAAPVSAMDRVVSSYTTTLTALTRARRRPAAPGTGRLVVGVADAPGLPHLPDVTAEVDAVPGATTRLTGQDATADRVLAALADHPWVHIACHGRQEVADPSSSSLAMCDRPLTVAEIAALSLPAAEFAFLSACETAASGGLPDEAVSVASALQLAGYRHVVATAWPIPDRSVVASAVHAGGEPGTALHEAVRLAMAAHPHTPTVWGAYQHFGP